MADHPGRGEQDVVPREATSSEKGWGSPMPPAYGSLDERPFVRENGAQENGVRGNGAGVAKDAGTARGVGRAETNGRLSTTAGVQPRQPGQLPKPPQPPQPRQRTKDRGRQSLRRRVEKLRAEVLKQRVRAEPERRTPAWTDWNPGVRDSTAVGSSDMVWPADAPTDIASPALDGAQQPVPAPETAAGGRTRVVTHLDVYSVAKMSIVFYLILLVVFVVASILLWLVADAFGAVDSIQRSIRSLFDVKSYVLHPGTIALYASALGAVLAVAGTIANVLAAVIYNLISEVVGGIRIGVATAEDAGMPAPTPASAARGRRRGVGGRRGHEPAGDGDSLKRM